MPEVSLSYLAILVSAFGSIVLGGLWYSPLLFGKAWVHLMGWSHEQMEHHKKDATRGYLLTIITSLLTAYILAHFVDYTQANTAALGAQTGFWVWLGFVATTMLGSFLWEGKKFSLYLINVAFQLVALVGMGILLAIWQ